MELEHKNCSNDVSIHDVCDFIVLSLDDGREDCNNLKLQKLLYYTQAWHLAFFGISLFEGKFEAWVHGPVNREIYRRFVDSKSLYSPIDTRDVKNKNAIDTINTADSYHIKSILEVYGAYSGTQLEEMTHEEKPWLDARRGCRQNERCETTIDEKTMETYYGARLEN